MEKEKKLSPAKQKIIANYEEQKERLLADGYEEKQEVISVLKANIMAFVTAGPFAALGLLVWVLSGRYKESRFDTGSGLLFWIVFWVVFFVTIFVHELLHGVGWSIWTEKKWKSIYLGMMWEYLTPYCHCREPLKPRQYLVGVLTPFAVLGIGLFMIALAAGSNIIFLFSLLHILSAGGDTTIACMAFRYWKENDRCYILDHPTDCGFVAFIKK